MNSDLIKDYWGVTVAGCLIFAGGFGLGYFVRSTKYEKVKFDEFGRVISEDGEDISKPEGIELTPEIRDAVINDFLKDARVDQERVENEVREERAIRATLVEEGVNFQEYSTIPIQDRGIPTYPKDKPSPTNVITADMVDEDIEWDWDEEAKLREGQDIYVLHRSEFERFKDSYYKDQSILVKEPILEDGVIRLQRDLTYFEEDDILVDEDERPIDNWIEATGPLTFGHGSGDPNIVFIRNRKLGAEYEITRFPYSYQEGVLGVSPE